MRKLSKKFKAQQDGVSRSRHIAKSTIMRQEKDSWPTGCDALGMHLGSCRMLLLIWFAQHNPILYRALTGRFCVLKRFIDFLHDSALCMYWKPFDSYYTSASSIKSYKVWKSSARNWFDLWIRSRSWQNSLHGLSPSISLPSRSRSLLFFPTVPYAKKSKAFYISRSTRTKNKY
jgi:hypothetical protein